MSVVVFRILWLTLRSEIRRQRQVSKVYHILKRRGKGLLWNPRSFVLFTSYFHVFSESNEKVATTHWASPLSTHKNGDYLTCRYFSMDSCPPFFFFIITPILQHSTFQSYTVHSFSLVSTSFFFFGYIIFIDYFLLPICISFNSIV